MSATPSKIMPYVAFGVSLGLAGFAVGSTIAAVSGEPVLSTGGLFAISIIAKSSLMGVSEFYVKFADKGTLNAETFARLKTACALGNGIISSAVIVGGYAAGLLGPIGSVAEASIATWLCYTIPRSESLEMAARFGRFARHDNVVGVL